jgi:hypothetical protein
VAGAAYAGLGLTGTFVVSAALGAAMLLVLVLLVPDREPARV